MLTTNDLKYKQEALDEAVMHAKREMVKYKDELNFTDKLVVINMQEPSYRKRLFVWDLVKDELIRSHHCAHGVKSSGPDRAYARNFSNVNMSKMSSIGAMKTGGTYIGKHGRSMRLHGLQKGLNDKVFERHIVLHAATYVTDGYIKRMGRAGESWGCPAVDPSITNSLIDLIRSGVFFYVYY